jgi:hypothetical protein
MGNMMDLPMMVTKLTVIRNGLLLMKQSGFGV